MVTKRTYKTRKAKRADEPSSHIIPGPVSDDALNLFKLDPENRHEAKRIAEYVEWQCAKDKEKVTYIEKIKSENVLGGITIAGTSEQIKKITGSLQIRQTFIPTRCFRVSITHFLFTSD